MKPFAKKILNIRACSPCCGCFFLAIQPATCVSEIGKIVEQNFDVYRRMGSAGEL